jgi:hypothetical protein
LSASRDCTVKLWDVETGFCDHTFTNHTDWVRCLAVRQSDGGLWASSASIYKNAYTMKRCISSSLHFFVLRKYAIKAIPRSELPNKPMNPANPARRNIYESYGVSRSFRRGSNTHAINQGVKRSDIDHNNRWSVVERAKGRAPKLGMQQHYEDVLQLLPTLLQNSSAL